MKPELIIGKLNSRAADFGIAVTAVAKCYILEQMAVKLSDSDETGDFLLCNFFLVGPDGLYSDMSPRLKYIVPEEKVKNKEKLTYILKRNLKFSSGAIEWTWRSEKNEEGYIYYINAGIGQMHIPVELNLIPREHIPTPQTYNIRLILENSQFKDLKIYPADEMIMEYIFEMMSKMMFLDDMSVPMDCYGLLSECDISGMEFSRKFKAAAEMKNLRLDKGEMDIFSRLKTDKLIKKRFKAYARQSGKPDISWADAFGMIYDFLSPVYEELVCDRLFVGDWMGDLGRYL